MSAPLRVICVGAGYFAAFHHEAWARHPKTEMVAVVDADIARAKAVGPNAYTSLSAALDAHDADIIDLVVPPTAHAAMVHEALEAKPRAIICQKPFANSLKEAEELAEASIAAGIPLIIHENFRFQPWYRAAKDELDAFALGDVQSATFRMRTGDGQGPDAYLARQPYFQTMPRFLVHETAVHWVDTFRYLFGPIEGVYADLRRLNPAVKGEDAGLIIFQFANGLRAVFDGNRHLDHATENPRLTFGEALIEGTEASLTLTGDGALMQRSFGASDLTAVLAPQAWPGFAGDCVYALQAHVVDALEGKGAFENLAVDYLTVRRVEEAIYRSSEEKRWVATGE